MDTSTFLAACLGFDLGTFAGWEAAVDVESRYGGPRVDEAVEMSAFSLTFRIIA